MKHLSVTVYFLFFIAFSKAAHNVHIYGGTDAAPGQFPFIALLGNPDQFCDGTIMDKQWIVTAAHCIPSLLPNSTVLVGTNRIHTGGTLYNITKSIIHEDYAEENNHNDVALIKIDGEITYTDLVTSIEIGGNEVNETCIAIGWGRTQDDDTPENLQFVELTSIDLEYCKSFSEMEAQFLFEGNLCTLGGSGKGTCFGDSGGPLICGGKLAGIVSWGMSPCAKGWPDVFTKAVLYKDWIKNIIDND